MVGSNDPPMGVRNLMWPTVDGTALCERVTCLIVRWTALSRRGGRFVGGQVVQNN